MLENKSKNSFHKYINIKTICKSLQIAIQFVFASILTIVSIKANLLGVSVYFDKISFDLNVFKHGQKYENNLTVDSIDNCSSLNGISESSRKIYLKKGRYEVSPVGGAWSAWDSDDSYREGNVKGAWTWVVYGAVQAGNNFCLGFCDNWWRFLTEEDAQLYGVNSGGEIISLDQDQYVYFWLYDAGGNIYDNRGKLKLKIRQLY